MDLQQTVQAMQRGIRSIVAPMYSVGRDLPADYPCNAKCGALQAHRITSMVGGKPHTVECKICGASTRWNPDKVLKPKFTAEEREARKKAKEEEENRRRNEKSAKKHAKTEQTAKEKKERAPKVAPAKPVLPSGSGFNPLPNAGMIWTSQVSGRVGTDYSTTNVYAKNDLISHPKFGTGMVVNLDMGKVQVLFESGVKTLASGN